MKFLFSLLLFCSVSAMSQTTAKLNQRIDSLVIAFNSNKATVNKNVQNIGMAGTQNANSIASAQSEIVLLKKNLVTPDASKFNVDAQGVLTFKTDYDATIISLQKNLLARPSVFTDTSLIIKIVGDTAKINRDRVDAQYRAMYKADQLIRDTARITRDSVQLLSDVVVTLLQSYKVSDDSIKKLQKDLLSTMDMIKAEADKRDLIIQKLINILQ